MSEEYKKELREQMLIFKKQKEEEFTRREKEWQETAAAKETAFSKKLAEEKEAWQKSLTENLRKHIQGEYEVKLKTLEENNKENEEKLKLSRQKELEYLQKEQQLKTKAEELELQVHRKLQEERSKLSEEIRKLEEQKMAARESDYQLRMKELEKQLVDQKKLVNEMKRKAEQGSIQLQGEVQELALESILKESFPFDLISEVGKGVKGADCIQTVRNTIGQDCGKIIYESKRTTHFSNDWIEKLKADMRSQGADVAVIVTQAMPKEVDRFGEKEGVWICGFTEASALAKVLRDGIIKIYQALKSQENKGDKMQLLYNYLTSMEFSEQWKAIREGFMSMKLSIQKERDAMERLWKAREKQLEKILLNAAHIRGSVDGISGLESVDLNFLETGDAGMDDMSR
jgi:hypothetical protein